MGYASRFMRYLHVKFIFSVTSSYMFSVYFLLLCSAIEILKLALTEDDCFSGSER